MSPDGMELPVIYLKSGEIFFSEKPVSVVTVLGSCLSVTMFHRHLGISGICHGLLPRCAKRKVCSSDCREEAKYVECSIRHMARHFSQLGAPPRDIEVKVFGGADMFGVMPKSRGAISVGKQNIETALSAIENAGLSVVSMDVGGTKGRKIFFNTHSGEVLLKRLQPGVILADDGEKK